MLARELDTEIIRGLSEESLFVARTFSCSFATTKVIMFLLVSLKLHFTFTLSAIFLCYKLLKGKIHLLF